MNATLPGAALVTDRKPAQRSQKRRDVSGSSTPRPNDRGGTGHGSKSSFNRNREHSLIGESTMQAVLEGEQATFDERFLMARGNFQLKEFGVHLAVKTRAPSLPIRHVYN